MFYNLNKSYRVADLSITYIPNIGHRNLPYVFYDLNKSNRVSDLSTIYTPNIGHRNLPKQVKSSRWSEYNKYPKYWTPKLAIRVLQFEQVKSSRWSEYNIYPKYWTPKLTETSQIESLIWVQYISQILDTETYHTCFTIEQVKSSRWSEYNISPKYWTPKLTIRVLQWVADLCAIYTPILDNETYHICPSIWTN